MHWIVEEHIPLEQGLRHSPIIFSTYRYICRRAYSIRTRIKTGSPRLLEQVHCVEEHIPLEQGLRPS